MSECNKRIIFGIKSGTLIYWILRIFGIVSINLEVVKAQYTNRRMNRHIKCKYVKESITDANSWVRNEYQQKSLTACSSNNINEDLAQVDKK